MNAYAKDAADIQIWTVDPLIKVFRDATSAGAKDASRVEVARGETATIQVVVRSDTALSDVKTVLAPLVRRSGREILTPRLPRFVGYVPVDRPTQKPSADQLRKPPCDYPDPLLEDVTMDVAAGQAQPVWLTVPIRPETEPGLYRGTLFINGKADGKPFTRKQKVSIRVYGASVGKSRLWVTDWFAMHALHLKTSPQPKTDAYYALLRKYARNMAEHRHNVALISAIGLAQFSIGTDGKLAVDFSEFDKWVDIFREEGVIGRIEGGHIGGRKAGWESEFVVSVHRVEDGKLVSETADPAGVEADAFYKWYFPTLVSHLIEKGWLDIYLQHLADEPIAPNKASYEAMAKLVRTYAPELKTVEACHTKDLVGSIDVWVPQLNYLGNDFAHYQERQRAGDEVWFYTCVFPQGEYANRFIEQPLIRTRLLHWINYRYGVTGYLHWGYNQWTQDSPFTHTTRAHGGPPYLPAGDPWIVYPGVDGPLDSIRFEAMRDGIADYELLMVLAGNDPQGAQQLAAKHILDFDRYDTDVERFRSTRRALLRKLSAEVND
jgi:hypothetical protein